MFETVAIFFYTATWTLTFIEFFHRRRHGLLYAIVRSTFWPVVMLRDLPGHWMAETGHPKDEFMTVAIAAWYETNVRNDDGSVTSVRHLVEFIIDRDGNRSIRAKSVCGSGRPDNSYIDNHRTLQEDVLLWRTMGVIPDKPRPINEFKSPPPRSATCFDRFGVPRTASADEVRAKFRDRAKTAHPDHGGSKEAFVELARLRDACLREIAMRGIG